MCWFWLLSQKKPVNVTEPLPVEEKEADQFSKMFIGGIRVEQVSKLQRPEPIRIPKQTYTMGTLVQVSN